MASIGLEINGPEWVYRGSRIIHQVQIAASNCRPAFVVDDQIVTLITSECKSLAQCPPFTKHYHKFAATLDIYEVIPGVGLGCQVLSGSFNYTRRSQNTDAGNYESATDAMDNLLSVQRRFDSTPGAIGGYDWAVDGGLYFGASAQSDKQCPNSTDGQK